MSDYILIVTPYHDFGEMLRLGLSKSEKHCPYLTHNSDEAIQAASRNPCSLAIIDTEMTDRLFRDLWQELRTIQPEIQLVLILPESEEDYPSLEGLAPIGCVDHLLYMPDFLELIESALPGSSPADCEPAPAAAEPEPELAEPNLDWLNDRALAGAHLEKQFPACSAEAALIARAEHVLAHTSQLESAAAQEMANRFTRYWNGNHGHSDLVRFIHLGKQNRPFLLYATSLVNDIVLAALYHPDTPLSQPHSQISKLARLLIHETPELPIPPSDLPQAEAAEEEVYSQRMRMVTGSLPYLEPVLKIDEEEDEEDDMAGQEFDPAQFHLEELLSKMPPPDPFPPADSADWQGADSSDAADEFTPYHYPWEALSPTEAQEELPEEFLEQPLPNFENLEMASDNPLTNGWSRENSAQSPTPPSSTEAEVSSRTGTRPLKRTPRLASPSDEALTSNSAEELGDCQYAYTTFLTPVLKRHALTRELAQILAKSMSTICEKNQWKLVNMTIRPSGMLWAARIPASISTGQMVKIVREETSDYLYELHPRLKYEALSENFWAPNYLVISGCEPPDDATLKEFLQRTHQTDSSNGARHKSP